MSPTGLPGGVNVTEKLVAPLILLGRQNTASLALSTVNDPVKLTAGPVLFTILRFNIALNRANKSANIHC